MAIMGDCQVVHVDEIPVIFRESNQGLSYATALPNGAASHHSSLLTRTV